LSHTNTIICTPDTFLGTSHIDAFETTLNKGNGVPESRLALEINHPESFLRINIREDKK